MSDVALNNIVARMKRFISDTVVSGTYNDSELEFYAQDATVMIPIDYPDFSTYVITVGTGIAPTPTTFDGFLISLKAASLAFNTTIIESIADAIMVKAGAITLDTSKSLDAKAEQGNKLEMVYNKIIENKIMDIAGANAIGARCDIYLEIEDDQNNADSMSIWT